MATEPSTDGVDALLRADEEELRAKRSRLRAFSRAVDAARDAIGAAQAAAVEIREKDGVSRADLGRALNLTSAEKTLLLPSRRSRLAQSEDGTVGHLDSSDAQPEGSLEQPAAQSDSSSHSESNEMDSQVQHEAD